jgi:hypothetical protein
MYADSFVFLVPDVTEYSKVSKDKTIPQVHVCVGSRVECKEVGSMFFSLYLDSAECVDCLIFLPSVWMGVIMDLLAYLSSLAAPAPRVKGGFFHICLNIW